MIGVLLRRTAAVWPLAAGAFVAVLLASALLAGAPMYARAAATAGFEAKLREAPVRGAGLEVTRRLGPGELAGASRIVEAALEDTLGDVSGLRVAGESGPLTVGDTRYVAAFYRGIAEHAALVRGRWPSPGQDVVEAAISAGTVARSGLAVGDELVLGGFRVRIVGEYAVEDLDDPLWWGDPLALAGVRGRTLLTFGPLVLAEPDFLARFDRFRGAWRIRPDAAEIGLLALSAGDIDTLEQGLRDRSSPQSPYVVTTQLAVLLDEARSEIAAARSGALVPLIQLALFAVYGLVFVAALMRTRRRREEQLLRMRGASPGAAAAAGALEAALLAVPAALAGPWVAAGLLRLLGALGPLADAGLRLEPRVDALAYAFAAGGALACAAALTLPRSPVPGEDSVRGRRRGDFFQRSGIDLGLLVLALVTLWQLRRGDPVIARGRGAQVDVLLVVVPALGLFAGAVLAARLVPAALGLFERAAVRGRGVLLPLAARRLARSLGEYRTTTLLLVAALALGTFAASYAETWTGVQEDRAALRVGAAVQVVPDRRTGALPEERLAEVYRAMPFVTAATPVVQQQLELAGGAAELVAIDAAGADLATGRHEREELSTALAVLAGRRTLPALPILVPEQGRFVVSVRVQLAPLTPDIDLSPPELPFELRPLELAELELEPALVVRDAHGLLHRFRGPRLERDGLRRVAFDLASPAGSLPGPLRLAAVELAYHVPYFISRVVRLELDLGGLGESWTTTTAVVPRPVTPARSTISEKDGRLVVRVDTGATAGQTGAGAAVLRPGGRTGSKPLPAIAGSGLLEALGARVGDVVEVDALGGRRAVVIAARLDNFPTLTGGDRFLVVDLPTLAESAYSERQELTRPDRWLLAAAPGRAEDVAAELLTAPISSAEAQALPVVERELKNDPVAVATTGALWLGVAAAALFAPAAFGLATAARLRREEFQLAALQALGLSRGRLGALLLVEGAVVAALGAALGLGLGLVLAEIVLPAVSFTETGEPSVPAPVVLIPWATVGVLALLLAAAIAATLGLVVRRASRLPVAGVLRGGDLR